ncbi:MAG: hypothetical protein PHT87_02515, partial [Bacteroidales bacterium]|nr:hypothetical protein [Bacteroidales bacterium]
VVYRVWSLRGRLSNRSHPSRQIKRFLPAEASKRLCGEKEAVYGLLGGFFSSERVNYETV